MLIYDIQIYELSDDAHKDIKSYHTIDKKKKKEHKEEKWENEEIRCFNEFITIKDVTNL